MFKVDLFYPKYSKAKDSFNDWKYTGVRARTPCIFFTIFSLLSKTTSLLLWTLWMFKAYVFYPKYTKEKPKSLLMIEYVPAYELVRCAHFWHFHLWQKWFFCAYQLSKMSKSSCYVKNMPNISQKPLIHWNYTGVRARTPCTFGPKNGVRARTPIHFSPKFRFSKIVFFVCTSFLICGSDMSLSKICFTEGYGPLNHNK